MKITKMLANKKAVGLVAVATTVAIAGGAVALATNEVEQATLQTDEPVIEEVAEESADEAEIVAPEDMAEEQAYATYPEETLVILPVESEEISEEDSDVEETEESEETDESEVDEEEEEEAENLYDYESVSDYCWAEEPYVSYALGEVYVRDIPDPNGDIVATLSAGEPLTVYAFSFESPWYIVEVNGTRGYANCMSFGSEGATYTPITEDEAEEMWAN